MRPSIIHLSLLATLMTGGAMAMDKTSPPLGLPPVPVPAANPQSPDKVALGQLLFLETRFSSTGDVSCSTCHDTGKAFTDSPKSVSEGIKKLKGTRNAPTVINSAYMHTLFWDGRAASLEEQSKGPFINPVEMGLKDHDPIIKVIRGDETYVAMFQKAFGIPADKITMKEVTEAIGAFERTIVSGDSPFDRWHYGGDDKAVGDDVKRGFALFTGKARCESCHRVSQTYALFTDNRFHNLNVSFDKISSSLNTIATAAKERQAKGEDVDVAVLTNLNISELGRFAVTHAWANVGAFKTPTLRNVALTAPYMHDGSLKTLEDVVSFYNNGGRVEATGPINDFQSGGIRPLNLTDDEQKDLVAFLKSLTSPDLTLSQN